MKIYYAHSVGIYNTLQEQRDIETLEALGFEVVNPNSEETQKGVEHYKATYGPDQVMKYFDAILDGCDALAFRPHADNKIGSGVGYEINYVRYAKPVIELPNLYEDRFISVSDTKQYLKYTGNR